MLLPVASSTVVDFSVHFLLDICFLFFSPVVLETHFDEIVCICLVPDSRVPIREIEICQWGCCCWHRLGGRSLDLLTRRFLNCPTCFQVRLPPVSKFNATFSQCRQ
ncbi:hypothetical protein CEXT_757831 [Caerostris extrusa]|uniref:Secreted protein n=1 Tax=Caerostris extrusa TaxID=172846 RepID=A0AAV4P6Y7_CAEEX|nr:hypothetical protein CEXT_757831 [Caerostris extrusa]